MSEKKSVKELNQKKKFVKKLKNQKRKNQKTFKTKQKEEEGGDLIPIRFDSLKEEERREEGR